MYYEHPFVNDVPVLLVSDTFYSQKIKYIITFLRYIDYYKKKCFAVIFIDSF